MKRLSLFLCSLAAMAASTLPPVCAQEEEKEKRPQVLEKAPESIAVDSLLDAPALFAMTAKEVAAAYEDKGFEWLSKTSQDRGTIKSATVWVKSGENTMSPKRVPLSIMNNTHGVVEANLEFNPEGKPQMVSLVLWSKGDSEKLNEKQFSEKVASLRTGLDTAFTVKGEDKGKDMTSAAKAQRIQWKRGDTMAQLEYSAARERGEFKPEFIRLRLAPVMKAALGQKEAAGNKAKVSKAKLPENVKRDSAGGDVYVNNVPMVDQGEKGYCAVATSERVFLYYGIPCDQHEMAQMAGSSAGGGTSLSALQKSLEKLEARFKVHVRKLYYMDVREWRGFVADYNKLAKRAGKDGVRDEYTIGFDGLDAGLLRDARSGGSAAGKFQRMVKEYVDKGVPLLWSLQLGIFPENGKPAMQAGGGHMRLIIGYNETTKEYLFSDSWGPGHELKRIAMADAFAATQGAFIIEPGAGH